MDDEELREELNKKVQTFPASVQATPAPKDEPEDKDVDNGSR